MFNLNLVMRKHLIIPNRYSLQDNWPGLFKYVKVMKDFEKVEVLVDKRSF